MYFLHWDFSDGKLLPACLVHYEQESYLSQEERINEEQTVERLKELAGIFNKIITEINENGFPDLCPPNWKQPEKEYPLFHLASQKDLGVLDVECDKIVGGNWANLPPQLRGPYPKPRKFWNLLAGFLNLTDQDKNIRNKIPEISVYKIFDDYFCDEGNHRLYVSRYLGLKTIKARVVEYDYHSFLKRSYVKKDHNLSWTYIAVLDTETGNTYLYDIDENAVKQYLKLKEKYQIDA